MKRKNIEKIKEGFKQTNMHISTGNYDIEFLDFIDKSIKRLVSPTAYFVAAFMMLQLSGKTTNDAQWLLIVVTTLAGFLLLAKVVKVFGDNVLTYIKEDTMFNKLVILSYIFGYLAVIISLILVALKKVS